MMQRIKWLIFAVLMAVVTLGASCPERSAIQKWTDTCATYEETLITVNDLLEIGAILPASNAAQSMKSVKASLSPICTADAPPENMDRETLQRILDRELVRLLKIQNQVGG